MILKEGVRACNIKPELMLALIIADRVYDKYGEELVVTSLNDGNHSRKSLHYSGQAADLRTRYFRSDEVALVAEDIRSRLGSDYDVVVESDHIHLEYQPLKH